MGVRRLATVSNEVHPTDDLTNSEEANDLSGGNTGKGQLLGAGVADTGEKSRGGGEGLEGGGVVDEGLEVGLESGQVARRLVRLGVIDGRVLRSTYGGAMFWPRNTSLPSSRPTLE